MGEGVDAGGGSGGVDVVKGWGKGLRGKGWGAGLGGLVLAGELTGAEAECGEDCCALTDGVFAFEEGAGEP